MHRGWCGDGPPTVNPPGTRVVLTTKVTREDKDEGEDEEKGHICLEDPWGSRKRWEKVF